ncbi:MFS family permease [Streptomyces sp. SAI-135]|uniref:MFS transporter n=1 Tax=unclassified Streptomyces TaxID=2593676 RepID=UPI00247692E1|nr:MULTISPECIES: MFS transporter [unclassified Streptomyces]MDH6519931.1 MFS family permease [Streptomyces sp. SAI-090]MDH6571232.1 MFS family permease [Streptomyces sp. SAI-117]MDH6615976.1 MFS family permease [Streptomyces sp. SAI-135]
MRKTWAVLHDRDARLCLTGVLVSGFGTSALWLVSGVWVKDLTGSDSLAALCMLAMWVPTLAGPLLGTIADRGRRKPLLIGGNLLLAALLPVLLTERVAVVLAVLLVYGATGVVLDAVESALVAGAVAPSLLGDFNGLRMAVNEGMKLVAPLAGAGLYALSGGPAVALLDAATFVLAALLYRGLHVREDGPRPSSRRTPFVEGARHIGAHPTLRPLILAGATTMLFAGINGALMYAVIDGLGHSPAYAGVLYAVQGAGSVAVGLVSGPALRRLGERRFAAYGIALTAVGAGLRAIPSDPPALACSAAIGAGLPCVLIAALTAVQRATPNALLGRTVATANTLVYTPNVLGLAVGAALVEPVDQRPLSAVLGVVWLAASLPLFQRPASASRIASRSPSDANPA